MRPDTVCSPLAEARRSLGLTRKDLALAAGVQYSTLYNAEAGIGTPPRRVLAVLARCGIDVRLLAEEQRAWVEKQGEEILRRIIADQNACRLAAGRLATAKGAAYACPRRPGDSAPSPESPDTRGGRNASAPLG